MKAVFLITLVLSTSTLAAPTKGTAENRSPSALALTSLAGQYGGSAYDDVIANSKDEDVPCLIKVIQTTDTKLKVTIAVADPTSDNPEKINTQEAEFPSTTQLQLAAQSRDDEVYIGTSTGWTLTLIRKNKTVRTLMLQKNSADLDVWICGRLRRLAGAN